MLMDALDPVVKTDLIARKASHSASHILFRLYTTYQPGGTGERNLVLSNLQNPQVIHDATAGVAALRDWGRWYQRCIDFGMNLPDPMVLVGALNSMTKPVISKDTEVTWRTEMVKSTLQLHARPTAGLPQAFVGRVRGIGHIPGTQERWFRQSTPQSGVEGHGWYCWG